jgi:hypothetical protein
MMSPVEYIPPYQEGSSNTVNDARIVETKIPNGNFILVRVPGSEKKLVLYESLMPFLKTDSLLDSFNFKFPMFIIAFVFVVFYQLYKRKNKHTE